MKWFDFRLPAVKTIVYKVGPKAAVSHVVFSSIAVALCVMALLTATMWQHTHLKRWYKRASTSLSTYHVQQLQQLAPHVKLEGPMQLQHKPGLAFSAPTADQPNRLALQRIQRCVVGNFTGVVFDYVEDFNQPPTSSLSLTNADFAANLAWAVNVAKNLGLAASPQEGGLVLALSGIVPQLDMAISTSCFKWSTCGAFNVMGESGCLMHMAAQHGDQHNWSGCHSMRSLKSPHTAGGQVCLAVIRARPWMHGFGKCCSDSLGWCCSSCFASPLCCVPCPCCDVQPASYGSTWKCKNTTPLPPSTTPCVHSKPSMVSVGC
jgi:hypothetical protein